MVLELFLVVLDLLLDALGGEVECMMDVAIPIDGHELMLVFRMGNDLDRRLPLPFAMEVHRDHNGREPIEIMEQLFRFVLELLLGVIGQYPVPS